jgi:DmsE family decaheme c-type cytochrome
MRGSPGQHGCAAFDRTPPRWAYPIALAALLLAACPVSAQQPPEGEKKAPPAPAASAAPTFVGSETCGACHEDIFKGLKTNRHSVVESDKKRGWDGKACEACHGPGSKHAESTAPADIQNPARLRASDSERTCLKCHANQPTNVGRVKGGHGRNEVACVSCHSVHQPKSGDIPKGRAKAVNAKCASCHQASWAQFQKPFTHRLKENAMSCIDCHNPHGTTLPSSMQAVNANEPGCFKCHGDKRGPFTFQHPPVQMEGCKACHEPHGSANPKMLTRHEERFVCLECHANVGTNAVTKSGTIGGIPPAIHDLRLQRFRSCSSCHVKVHGSHIDRAFTR